jgi:SAM-dependent methyltransferase
VDDRWRSAGVTDRDKALQDHLDYDLIEEKLNAAVAVSLGPRNPDYLFDVISSLGLPAGAVAVDVGCGAGRQSLELARRFTFTVTGVDPAPRYKELMQEAREGAERVSFQPGTAEALPIDPNTVDLVLYREMLYLVEDLVPVFSECRRVLKPTGRAVVSQLFSTEWLEPREAERFWTSPGLARNADRDYFERSLAESGLAIEEMIELGSETVEWAEEQNGKAARELLAAARLIRQPERYISQFGREAYDIKLNDAFWFIYRMIGKLTQRIYVLRIA